MSSIGSAVIHWLVEASLGDLILVASLAFVIIWVVYYVYLRYVCALAGIPGPPTVICSRLWLAYHAAKGDMHKAIPELHRKYGPLVRIAPNEVSVADLDAIREIYGLCRLLLTSNQAPVTANNGSDTGPGSKFRKSDWYSESHATVFQSSFY